MQSNLARKISGPLESYSLSVEKPITAHSTSRANLLLTLLDVLAIAISVGFICFTNLSSPSIGMGDETIYVRAAQGMEASGDYLRPLVDNSYFFGKPPLRMWLTPIATSLLGQSNFALRAPDAVCGLLLALLLYAFARSMFSSRLVGLLAPALMFGCSAYVLNHGPRMAVIDSLLVLLFSAVMFCAWKVFAALDKPDDVRRNIVSWSVAGGAASGLCILTKSGAGIVPLIVLAVFAVLSLSLPKLWKRASFSIWIVAACTTLVSAPYFLYHCMFSNGACQNLIGLEVIERAVSGFHNTDKPDFYLIRIFSDGAYFPPLMILVSLAYSLYLAIFQRSKAALYLLCWAVVPVVFYSFMASRLTWYISPAAPAAALLIALSLSHGTQFALKRLNTWLNSETRFPVPSYALSLILLCGYYLTAQNLWHVSKAVLSEKGRLDVDLLAHSVLAEDKQNFYWFYQGKLSWDERAYLHMLRDRTIKATEIQEIKAATAINNFSGVVLTDFHRGIELVNSTSPDEYAFFPPHWDRPSWLAALNYGQPMGGVFLPSKRPIAFGSENFSPLYGWESAGSLHRRPVRKMTGASAGFLVRGDFAFRELGTKVAIKSAYLRGENPTRGVNLKIFLNDRLIGTITPKANSFSVDQFVVEPKLWQVGMNSLIFRAEPANIGSKIPAHSLVFDWMILRPNSQANKQ